MNSKTNKMLPKVREIGEVEFKMRDALETGKSQPLKL